MSNINATLSMAQRALLTSQAQLSITGENIANVNTPGYARRRGLLVPGPAIATSEGIFGSGVMMKDVFSMRDTFIERQLRRAMGDSGRYEQSSRQLEMVEGVLGELGETGIAAALDRFWNSWHDLSADPTSRGAKAVVQEAALGLVNRFKNVDTSLRNQDRDINRLIIDKIERVNTLIGELSHLNSEMLGKVGSGELDDTRAGMLDELAKLVGATYELQDDGTVTLLLNGVALVESGQKRELAFEVDRDGKPVIQPLSAGGVVPRIETGELAGLIDARDEYMGDLRQRLDELVTTIATEVNQIHSTGYDGYGVQAGAFFDPSTTGIDNFDLSAAVTDDERNIASSSSGVNGNNEIALAIAELETKIVLGGETIGEAYRSIAVDLGSRIRENQLLNEAAGGSLQQMESYRDSASGVSLDEEMANLIRYQNSFNAAAKLTQTVSKMLEVVMSIGGV
jgi:flagellar hook-associated protein 1 FlgK